MYPSLLHVRRFHLVLLVLLRVVVVVLGIGLPRIDLRLAHRLLAGNPLPGLLRLQEGIRVRLQYLSTKVFQLDGRGLCIGPGLGGIARGLACCYTGNVPIVRC